MYHYVARVYIAQNVSKHQRRGRPRPWSLELFCLVFWGSRHWLKNNLAAFMHSLQTHLCKEQRFDTEKQHKIWSHPKFLEVTWRQMNSVRRVYKRIIYGTNRYVRWRLWRVLLSTSSATIQGFWPLRRNQFMITWLLLRNWGAIIFFVAFQCQIVVPCIGGFVKNA